MKTVISISIFILLRNFCLGQNYSTLLDTFYVPSPEYSSTLGIDSLHFPCAITKPNDGDNFPVLILVHGTSALDMDANSSKSYLDSIGAESRKASTRTFYDMANALSNNGIMVLRHDKRSYTLNCIEKPECWYVDTISPYDYIKDIHYAIDFVKNIPNVDTCNIFLAGHSQGGSFVSQVGNERSDIRGVLNMAGTAQPIDSVAIYQEEFLNGDPSGAHILRQQFDSLRMDLWPKTKTLFNHHFSPSFWRDWILHTDSAVIVQQNSDKRTALMYGTADRFVPSSIHYQIWRDSVSRPNVTFQLFEDLGHTYSTVYDSIVDPQVLEFMSDWINDNSENCITTSVEEVNNDLGFSIHPNPVSDIVIIQTTARSYRLFQLLDISGKIVMQGNLKNQNIEQLDISMLNNGIYFLRVGSTVRKLVKN